MNGEARDAVTAEGYPSTGSCHRWAEACPRPTNNHSSLVSEPTAVLRWSPRGPHNSHSVMHREPRGLFCGWRSSTMRSLSKVNAYRNGGILSLENNKSLVGPIKKLVANL
ncbi:hypothetical protein B296_00033050 [Ensete ventricosum]|uniref:Uncharacterized protein n=1 Tax=Ensete ventricosum TaxID=4639 RepID=A0A427ABZ2_ENSVE|nr:hypothetical protein B296_00033050 [Ensete ventricosum]